MNNDFQCWYSKVFVKYNFPHLKHSYIKSHAYVLGYSSGFEIEQTANHIQSFVLFRKKNIIILISTFFHFQKLKYPKSVAFIICNEFCERFNYYGMRGNAKLWDYIIIKELELLSRNLQ